MGEFSKLAGDDAKAVRTIYLSRHENARYWVDYEDFAFYRMEVADVYFVGGFGVMGWVTAEDYLQAEPDPLAEAAPSIIEHMNAGPRGFAAAAGAVLRRRGSGTGDHDLGRPAGFSFALEDCRSRAWGENLVSGAGSQRGGYAQDHGADGAACAAEHLGKTLRDSGEGKASLAAGARGFPRRSYRRAYPAANGLSLIFERIGRLNGLTYASRFDETALWICAAWESRSQKIFRRHHPRPQCRRTPLYGLRKSSTTSVRRILASMFSIREKRRWRVLSIPILHHRFAGDRVSHGKY